MRLARLAAAALFAASCNPPEVRAPLSPSNAPPACDPQASPPRPCAPVSGEVVFSGTARGRAVVLLFRAADPPPPEGLGRPITFTVVPEDRLFGGALGAGPFSAPFTFPQIPRDVYTVRGFLDTHGDWTPFLSTDNQADKGDVGGGHLDVPTTTLLGSAVFQPITVLGGSAVRGVTVILDEQRGRFDLERPVFTVEGADLVLAPGLFTPLKLHVARPGAAFRLQRADLDPRDGAPDGLDALPIVLLTKLNDANPLLEAVPTTVIPATPVVTRWLPLLEGRDSADVLSMVAAVPAVALQAQASGGLAPLAFRDIPEGRYAVHVINPSGQTWRIPNELNLAGGVTVTRAAEVPAGAVTGTVQVPGGPRGKVFVFLFAKDKPPPPAGSGSPVAATGLAPSFFHRDTGTASFRLDGVRDGEYLVTALHDADRNFLPHASWAFTGATFGDGVAAFVPVTVAGGAQSGAVDLITDTPTALDRPVFEAAGPLTLAADARDPTAFELRTKALRYPGIGTSAARTKFVVRQRGTDSDFDNLPDLFPIVALKRTTRADGLDDEDKVIPAAVDPLTFLPAFASNPEASFFVDRLRVLVPPAAVELTAPLPTRLDPIPSGRYAIYAINPSGQLWRTPNDLQPALLDEAAAAKADTASQAVAFTVSEMAPSPPAGAIQGTVTWTGTGQGNVYVLAFRASRPPPPEGAGTSPVGSAVIPGAFLAAGPAPYKIPRLADGPYVVVAFRDMDRDFAPYYSVRRGITKGDAVAAPQVAVITGGAPATANIVLSPAGAAPFARPVFEVVSPDPLELDTPPAAGLFSFTLRIAGVTHAVHTQDAADAKFVVKPGKWQAPDNSFIDVLYPVVALQKLDPADPLGLHPASPPVAFLAVANAANYTGATFPVLADEVEFQLGWSTATGGPPPAGRYSLTVINGTGQTWTSPNELQQALYLSGTAPAVPSASTSLLVK